MPKNKETSKIKPKNTLGRPSDYTDEIGDFICEIISTTTLGLPSICVNYKGRLPHHDTVRQWRLKNDSFAVKYARAKMMQADLLAEECLEISDNSIPENYNVDRLRIDTRKWLASKLLPKQYGDTKLLEQKTEENEQLREELIKLRSDLDERNKRKY